MNTRRCDHLDCTLPAAVRIDLPAPIGRRERACYDHALPVLGSIRRGLTVRHIGET